MITPGWPSATSWRAARCNPAGGRAGTDRPGTARTGAGRAANAKADDAPAPRSTAVGAPLTPMLLQRARLNKKRRSSIASVLGPTLRPVFRLSTDAKRVDHAPDIWLGGVIGFTYVHPPFGVQASLRPPRPVAHR